jgi:hypothetical protein
MNTAQMENKLYKQDQLLKALIGVLEDAGMVKLCPEGIRVPKLKGKYIADGKEKPVYEMDENGMVKYFEV